MSITFEALREANLARLPQFKNAQGELAHDKADGSDWTPADWSVAVTGEWGEANNLMKKIRRGDFAGSVAMSINAEEELAREFADVIIYLDILAAQFGIDLGDAVRRTFNNKSVQVGSDVMIEGEYRRID